MKFLLKAAKIFAFTLVVSEVLKTKETTTEDGQLLYGYTVQGRFLDGQKAVTFNSTTTANQYGTDSKTVLISMKNKSLKFPVLDSNGQEQTDQNGDLLTVERNPTFLLGKCVNFEAKLSYYLNEENGEVIPTLRVKEFYLEDIKPTSGKISVEMVPTYATIDAAVKSGLEIVESTQPADNGAAGATNESDIYNEKLVAHSGQTSEQLAALKTNDPAGYKVLIDAFVSKLPRAQQAEAATALA